MRALLLVVLCAVTACAQPTGTVPRYNQMAYDDCLFYGFTPGTDAFGYCMMKRGAVRPNAGFR